MARIPAPGVLHASEKNISAGMLLAEGGRFMGSSRRGPAALQPRVGACQEVLPAAQAGSGAALIWLLHFGNTAA